MPSWKVFAPVVGGASSSRRCPRAHQSRDLYDRLQPHARDRVYVNFLGDEGPDRVRQAYGTEKYDRLVELKRKYDPTNFFRLNQNIPPYED